MVQDLCSKMEEIINSTEKSKLEEEKGDEIDGKIENENLIEEVTQESTASAQSDERKEESKTKKKKRKNKRKNKNKTGEKKSDEELSIQKAKTEEEEKCEGKQEVTVSDSKTQELFETKEKTNRELREVIEEWKVRLHNLEKTKLQELNSKLLEEIKERESKDSICLSELKQDLSEAEDKIKKLETEFSKKEKTLSEELEKESAEKQQLNAKYENEIKLLEGEVDSEKEENRKQAQTITRIEEEKSSLIQKLKQSNDDVEQSNNQKQELQTQISQIQTHHKSQLIKIQTQFDTYNQQIHAQSAYKTSFM